MIPPLVHQHHSSVEVRGFSFYAVDFLQHSAADMADIRELAVHSGSYLTWFEFQASENTDSIELVAMSHIQRFLKGNEMTKVLWSMIPETLAFAPLGVGIVPYDLPSSVSLAEATLEKVKDYDVVMWEKHGTVAVGQDVMNAFDQTDVLCKAANIYMCAKAMGSEPDDMTDEQMKEVQDIFRLPKKHPC